MNSPIELMEERNINFKAKEVMLYLLCNPTIKTKLGEFFYEENPDGYPSIRAGAKE